MRHYGSARRRKRSYRPRIQHSPASIGNSVLTNDQLVTFHGVSTVVAGTSAATSRVDSDRAVELSSGSKMGNVTIDVGFRSILDEGFVEYIVFKAQRQFTTPVKGTDPLPSDTEVIAAGLQQEYRLRMPGWIIQFGMIPVAPETANKKTIKINWNKFRMGVVRDGDFFGVTYFNRTGGAITLDWQCRYFEYK